MSVERRDFLVELGTEELPPKALRGLEQAFANGIRAGLGKAGLAHGDIASFATPRRLAVLVKRLAHRQPDQDIRRRGPPLSASFDGAGAPTRAASAFAASCGVPVEQLQKLEEGKGTFLFFIGTKPGALVNELIPQIVQASLDALPIPRRMHWGSGTAEFVRPVHWLLMLYGKNVIPATILETVSGNLTRGHRFHAPKPLRITTPGAYERALQQRGFVRAAFGARRDLIAARVAELAQEVGGRAVISEDLLEEVTALVEWPVPLAGRFEERFLSLPREVLISTLQDHQRYFPVEDSQGRLLPNFIAVSNIESREPSKVREGNERVVRPRLADAAFFFEQDRKQPLAARLAALDKVTYHVKLGSQGDKTRRVSALAIDMAAALQSDRVRAGRAGELCKCDLLTAMVGEFPELQGIMGTYYARADGEDPEVATAIREHYLPRGAGDELPQTPSGVAVALADKLDTLAGIFAINEKPTGTKDPFGLRRAAIGILRILIEKGLDLDLRDFIAQALERVRTDITRLRGAAVPVDAAAGATPVYEFIMERLRAYYLESASVPGETSPVPDESSAVPLTGEMFDAVLATRPASPLDFDARLKALSVFLRLPEAASLAAANKRTANILRKSGVATSTEVDVEHLRDPAEVRLFDAMRSLRESVTGAVAQREYTRALGTLAQLRPAVDAFFEQVMVMDEDPQLRANRLGLLAQLHGLFGGIADLSRLPG